MIRPVFTRLLSLLTITILVTAAGNVLAAPNTSPWGDGALPEIPIDRFIVQATQTTPSGITRPVPLDLGDVESLSAYLGIQLDIVRHLTDNATVLSLGLPVSRAEAQRMSAALSAQPDIAYAEPDIRLFPTATPNDTRYNEQWHYFESLAGIELPDAWDLGTGSSDIVVAVLDTGITSHTDLQGRYAGGYDFISDYRIGNDGNGRDSNPSDPGDWITWWESYWGFFGGCPVSNSSWHGTHVAGTIGAKSNNSTGVAGANWVSMIQPIRVLGKCGGYTSDIADGVRWAAGWPVSGAPVNPNPARVLNLSLGGSGSCGTTMQNAINDAVSAGAVVVVAAGNSNTNAANATPANCQNVITVAATDRGGNRAYYSNYGSTVEISAPGGETNQSSGNGILSTLNTGNTSPGRDTYAFYQGTSMATPHVAGVASLILSQNPSLTPPEVLQIIQDTAKPFPGGSSCNTANCGGGIIDAYAAVMAATANPNSPPMVDITSPSNGHTVDQGVSITFQATASDTEDDDLTLTNAIAWTSSRDGNLGSGSSVTTSSLSPGTHTITASVTDSGGEPGQDSISVTVVPTITTIHVSDLDGSTSSSWWSWSANATITVQDQSNQPVSNATVSGGWSSGSGNSQCVTNASGRCTVNSGSLWTFFSSSTTYTVNNIVHGSHDYRPQDNTDPDGDSNGTSITISR